MQVDEIANDKFIHFSRDGIRLILGSANSGECMFQIIRCFNFIGVCLLVLTLAMPLASQHQATRVLWFSAMPDMGPEVVSSHRETMARYADEFQNGQAFNVTYTRKLQGGGLASELQTGQYDIVVLDMANRRNRMNGDDIYALQQFYAGGRSALILDGSFAIRNITHNPATKFPGVNGSSAGLLINELAALAERGGGILIGTDHNIWQPTANAAVNALVPGAQFSGTTNPSTDGDFIGDLLLGTRVTVTAADLLRHWESVPNQGEAPVGQFSDFMGRPIELYSLVETADKPGGGRKRPYISASFSPGDRRIPIDSEQQVFDNLPTHKSSP